MKLLQSPHIDSQRHEEAIGRHTLGHYHRDSSPGRRATLMKDHEVAFYGTRRHARRESCRRQLYFWPRIRAQRDSGVDYHKIGRFI